MKLSSITKRQARNIVKTAAYLAVSSVISGVITLIADDPTLFGPLTPTINLALVTLKQLFTKG